MVSVSTSCWLVAEHCGLGGMTHHDSCCTVTRFLRLGSGYQPGLEIVVTEWMIERVRRRRACSRLWIYRSLGRR